MKDKLTGVAEILLYYFVSFISEACLRPIDFYHIQRWEKAKGAINQRDRKDNFLLKKCPCPQLSIVSIIYLAKIHIIV